MEMSYEIHPKRKENPKTSSGKLLWVLEKSMHNLRHFILRNKTIVDYGFITIYLLEQLGFLYLILSPRIIYDERTITAIFIAILLSTMAFEKVLLELRLSTTNQGIVLLKEKNYRMKSLLDKYKNFIKENSKKR
jgi:hypothetical protein